MGKPVLGRKRVADLGLSVVRPARVSGRVASAVGGFSVAVPKPLSALELDVGSSSSFQSGSRIEGSWPKLGCSRREERGWTGPVKGRVPESISVPELGAAGCVSAVGVDGMVSVELLEDSVSDVDLCGDARCSVAADAAITGLVAGCVPTVDNDGMAGLELVGASVSTINRIGAAKSSMDGGAASPCLAAGAASRRVAACCVSNEGVDVMARVEGLNGPAVDINKLDVGVNRLAADEARILGDVPSRVSAANSLSKPFGFGLADLDSDEIRGMVTGATTYADMLRSQSQSGSWADDIEEDVFTDADALFVPGRCGLNLKFSKRVLDALDRNWRHAVIVKLMGKPSSKNVFEFVLRGLRRKWHSKGCWKLIDLPNDYFVVNFELEEDMVKALCDGPWVLGGHTLIVRRWCATFNPLTDVVRSMAVWARVEGLPLRYFTEFAMTKIGKLIGEEVVRVDHVTTQKERGRYGRVCVEIDLNKPFKSMIEVEDILYKVRYEGLDHLCFKCGMYGHADESCMVEKVQMAVDSEGCEGPSGHACEGGKGNTVEEVKATDKEVVDDGFGPWMIMDYKSKKRNGKVLETKPMSPQGSRFSVLHVEGDAWPHKATSEANEKMEVDVDVGREEAHPVIPRVPHHDLLSAPSPKAKKNSKLPKDSIKLTKEPVVSRTRGPPSTPHPSYKLVAIQSSRGRSHSEDVCVSTEAPPFEDGVKRIVARFEGADAATCRDSSFPFCSSSHAG